VLLAVIVGVFAIELFVGGPGGAMNGPSRQRLFDLGALYPPAVALGGQYWRLFTAMFLHAGLFHILFNGWALWVFGSIVERDYGTPRFLAIYFVSGFLASVTSYAFGSPIALAVGASGAIFGIFGAFVVYNYKRRHLALAAQNLRTAVMLLVLNALLAFTIGTIDWHAHLGGFLAGLACGVIAEGFGSRTQRTLVAVLGFSALVAAGVALAMWRTAELRDILASILQG
jgi:rhomboid protease GluP